MRGHLASEVNASEDGEVTETMYREGWSVYASQKKIREEKGHWHFEGVHEAMATLAQKNFTPVLLELPMFRAEKELRETDAWKKTRSQISERENIKKEEILFINPENTERWGGLGYSAQRKTLAYVFEELQKQFPEKYKTTEDVYYEFLRAHFSGQIGTLARDTEATFGEGGFRILGNMDIDKKNAVLAQDTLEKMRMRMLKKR